MLSVPRLYMHGAAEAFSKECQRPVSRQCIIVAQKIQTSMKSVIEGFHMNVPAKSGGRTLVSGLNMPSSQWVTRAKG